MTKQKLPSSLTRVRNQFKQDLLHKTFIGSITDNARHGQLRSVSLGKVSSPEDFFKASLLARSVIGHSIFSCCSVIYTLSTRQLPDPETQTDLSELHLDRIRSLVLNPKDTSRILLLISCEVDLAPALFGLDEKIEVTLTGSVLGKIATLKWQGRKIDVFGTSDTEIDENKATFPSFAVYSRYRYQDPVNLSKPITASVLWREDKDCLELLFSVQFNSSNFSVNVFRLVSAPLTEDSDEIQAG